MYSHPNMSVEQTGPGDPAAGDDEVLARHPNKTPYASPFFVEMLEQCATVEQVKE